MELFKGKKEKKEKKLGKTQRRNSIIGTPFNVVRTAHVTPEFNWEVERAEEVIKIEKQIGRG